MAQAAQVAEETGKLVTIGIRPTFPCTGYGYIRAGRRLSSETPLFCVEEFVEKPDTETAKAYLSDGGYLWNSGMFIWKASVILAYFERLLPDIYACLQEIGDALSTAKEEETLERVYPVIPKISVDYGIMERANGIDDPLGHLHTGNEGMLSSDGKIGNVLMLEGDFGWNDVGSFDALAKLHPADEDGNIFLGEHHAVDTKDCITYSRDRLIATVGLKNLIIVETKDALLVCDRDRAQEVKSIAEGLRLAGREEYL